MYGYQPIVPNSAHELLAYYRQEEIFSIVFGFFPVVGQYYKSPFRKDRNAGCFFEWVDGNLLFTDFADKVRVRGCFKAVMDYYSLPSLVATTEYIVNYFEKNAPILKPTVQDFEHEEKEKERSRISFRAKQFADPDRLFWKQYEITKQQLITDNVFSVLYYKVDSAKKHTTSIIRPTDICYAINGFDNNRTKIYRPMRKGKNKWATNCTQDDVGGLKQLPLTGDNLIITKSYKDNRVILNQDYNVIWFQNEGMFPNDLILYDLSTRFDNIHVVFDNDAAGIKATNDLIAKFKVFDKKISGFQSPYKYLKDPAEIISVKGRDELRDFLWKNCQV